LDLSSGASREFDNLANYCGWMCRHWRCELMHLTDKLKTGPGYRWLYWWQGYRCYVGAVSRFPPKEQPITFTGYVALWFFHYQIFKIFCLLFS
jgi:hypothetical protein